MMSPRLMLMLIVTQLVQVMKSFNVMNQTCAVFMICLPFRRRQQRGSGRGKPPYACFRYLGFMAERVSGWHILFQNDVLGNVQKRPWHAPGTHLHITSWFEYNSLKACSFGWLVGREWHPCFYTQSLQVAKLSYSNWGSCPGVSSTFCARGASAPRGGGAWSNPLESWRFVQVLVGGCFWTSNCRLENPAINL